MPQNRSLWPGLGAGLAVIAAACLVPLVRRMLRPRLTAQEFERRRRVRIQALGKLGDANLIDVKDDVVFYSYEVRGVSYTASQDVSLLQPRLPYGALMGPVYVKYDPKNPADSIILAEDWSGFIQRS